MLNSSRSHICKFFSKYYSEMDFSIPSIEKREFGIGNIKKIDARHLSFDSTAAFRQYLTINTPFFVSHSISYYDFPSATPIQRKQWREADLVFDLDIHAEGKFGAYAQLESIKNDTIKLVEDFLKNDFGFKDITIVFSGNRGYHVHVRDESFKKLGGDERRDIIDYIMGRGLNYAEFFTFSDKKQLIGPSPDEGGYRGKFARETINLINKSPNLISKLLSNAEKREFFISGIKTGNWSRTSLKLDDLLSRLKVVSQNISIKGIDTDAAVTADLSKLIRVPNSIHGESGFIAKIIAEKDLEKFDPFVDALLPAHCAQNSGNNDAEIKIKFIEDVPIIKTLKFDSPSYAKDSEQKLPFQMALFYVLKGSAEFS